MICLKLCRRIFVGFIALSWSANAFAAAYVGSAYEPFNYTVGSNLVIASNFNGGTGWNATGTSAANAATGAWGDTTALPAVGGSDAAKTITTPSLTYSVSGYPASTGNKTTIDGTSATNNVSRNIGQTVDTGTFYFSYLSKLALPRSEPLVWDFSVRLTASQVRLGTRPKEFQLVRSA